MLGGGHEATSVTAEATTTEPTAQDNQVQAEAETTAPQSTEELSDEAMVSGAMTVADGPVVFEESDFSITGGNTVTGFSAEGLEKAKKMTAESVLTFPANVTTIADGAFKFDKISSDLSNGIVGKVVFHGEITSVGVAAFQGNTKITAVEALEGESIEIKKDAFNPSDKSANGINGEGLSFDDLKKNLDSIAKSEISSLVLNRKKVNIGHTAFFRSSIQSLDFRSVTESGSIGAFAFFGSSSLRSVESFGMISNIWLGAFGACDLTKVHISGNLGELRHRAFMDNPNLEVIHFAQRDESSPTLTINANAFAGSKVRESVVVNADGSELMGAFRFPDGKIEMYGRDWIGGHNQSSGFGDSKIEKLIGSDNGMFLGNNNFRNATIETIENLFYTTTEGSVFADTQKLKNVSFKYTDKNAKNIGWSDFGNGLLKSVEVPDYINSIAGNAYQNNPGWIDGDTRVALYRKNADNAYVTDSAVADGDSFVINPVFVTYELKNQYGVKITEKEINLVVDADRNNVKTEDVAISKEGNKESFKLGDSLTLKGTDIEGLTLKAVNGEEYKADTALTIDPTKTIEVIYGPDYKIGYKKFVISLTYNDPNAKDPNAVIYIEPVVPNNDTNNNNDNNSNNNNTDNTVSPSIIPNEDLSIDALPTEIVEEDIDIDGENTPLGANDIVEGEEEDLEIEGDETPLGKGKIDGKDGKKNTGILAKTGGLHVMLYQMLGLLAVLILGYFGFTFVAKKKKSER